MKKDPLFPITCRFDFCKPPFKLCPLCNIHLWCQPKLSESDSFVAFLTWITRPVGIRPVGDMEVAMSWECWKESADYNNRKRN